MKKILTIIMTTLIASTTMAMETATSKEDLLLKVMSEPKLVAVVYTLAKDKRSLPILNVVREYEKKHSDVVFVLAPLENLDLLSIAQSFGIQNVPTTLFSKKGVLIAGAPGTPKDLAQMEAVIKKIQELSTKTEGTSTPPAPAAPKQEGVIYTPGVIKPVNMIEL